MKKRAPRWTSALFLGLGAMVACWVLMGDSPGNVAIFALIICAYTLWRLEKLEQRLEVSTTGGNPPLESSPDILIFNEGQASPPLGDTESGKARVA